jgi:hypothetical protein
VKETVLPSPATAVLYAKQMAVMRVISVAVAFMFWCFASLLMAMLYLHGLISIPGFSQSLQLGSLLGLTPLAVAFAVWRSVEWGICFYVADYARKHVIR